MTNPFDTYLANLERLAPLAELNEQTIRALTTPDKIIEKELEVTMDDGRTPTLPAYRVQWSNARRA